MPDVSQHTCPWVAGKFLGLPAHSSNRGEWHLNLKSLFFCPYMEQWLYLPARQIHLTPGLSQSCSFWMQSKKFPGAVLAPVWIKGQTSILFIWLLRWLARLSGWRSLFGKGRMSGLMQLQGDWIGTFTGSLRSGQKAVAVTKQLGKLYCWSELMLSTKALHYCVPVKSNFALILCVWGKNWQRRGEENGCKTFIHACFSVCLFQHLFSPYARFPPERKTVCMHIV